MIEEIQVIAVGADGWVDASAALESEGVASSAGFHRPWWRDVTFFHRDGQCYEVALATPERKMGLASRALAATFFNPRIRVRYEYRVVGPYALSELKQALRTAIEADDDSLTQFHEADELQERLAAASSFEDVAAVVELTNTDSDSA